MGNFRLGIRRLNKSTDQAVKDMIWGHGIVGSEYDDKLKWSFFIYVSEDNDSYKTQTGLNPLFFNFRFLNNGPLQTEFVLAPAQPGESSGGGTIIPHVYDPNYKPSQVSAFGKYFIVNLWQLMDDITYDGAGNMVSPPYYFNADWLEVSYNNAGMWGYGLLYLK